MIFSNEATQWIGVCNLTPDSFSDGGRFFGQEGRKRLAQTLTSWQEAGLEWIELGGESTGPGSQDIRLQEELERLIPVLAWVKETFPHFNIAVDTWRSQVAEQALDLGANMINDVTAGRGDGRLLQVVASYKVPVVLMYSKDATPRTTKNPIEYENVCETIATFLEEKRDEARALGVKEILLDPGMGAFVSTIPDYSWEILEKITFFQRLGCPLFLGASRKSFLGDDRFGGTLATSLQVWGKIAMLRVHDYIENASASCPNYEKFPL